MPSVPLCVLRTVSYISAKFGAPNVPEDPLGSFTENPTLPPGVKLPKLASPPSPPLVQYPPRLVLVSKI